MSLSASLLIYSISFLLLNRLPIRHVHIVLLSGLPVRASGDGVAHPRISQVWDKDRGGKGIHGLGIIRGRKRWMTLCSFCAWIIKVVDQDIL